MRNLNRFAPLPTAVLLDFWKVASANTENNLFNCYLFRPRPLEKGRKFAECPRAHEIEGSDLLPKLFIAPYEHLRVRKSQFTNDFREKCGLLEVGFDQKNAQAGADDFQRQAGKSAARANVGEPTILHRDSHSGVHALAEMTIKYLQRVANRSEVYFHIP